VDQDSPRQPRRQVEGPPELTPPRRRKIPWVTIVVFAVGIAAVMPLITSRGGVTPAAPSSPITCGSGDLVELIGITKDVPGVAVTAGDGCRLKISGGALRGAIAVRATGRSIVTIEGATIEGTEAAIDADASVKVTLTQCSTQGPVAIRAREQAYIVLEMGTVKGTTTAIEARDRARVDVKSTLIGGPTVSDPLARIVLDR
jgi:hypothetical protein